MVRIKCSNKMCGYLWEYTGIKKKFVQCPDCRRFVNIKENMKKD